MLEVAGFADTGHAIRDLVHCWFQDRAIGFFGVADGMPAENKNDATAALASSVALHTVYGVLAEQKVWLQTLGDVLQPKQREELRRQLRIAMHRASRTLRTTIVDPLEARAPIASVAALIVRGDRGFLAYSGTAEARVLRSGVLELLLPRTIDDELSGPVVELDRVRLQRDTPQLFAEKFPPLGREDAPRVYVAELELHPGDRYLLSTASLLKAIDDDPLVARVLHEEENLQRAAQKLTDLANAKSGAESTAQILVRIPSMPQSRATQLDKIRHLILFQMLSNDELLSVFAGGITLKTFAAGARIYDVGDENKDIFIVLSGRVELRKKEGEPLSASDGQVFGETELFLRCSRRQDARAIVPTKILVMSRELLHREIRERPTVAAKLLWQLVHALAIKVTESESLEPREPREPQEPQEPDLRALPKPEE